LGRPDAFLRELAVVSGQGFVKINREAHYLWRVLDHEGEGLECCVTKRRMRLSPQGGRRIATVRAAIPD